MHTSSVDARSIASRGTPGILVCDFDTFGVVLIDLFMVEPLSCSFVCRSHPVWYCCLFSICFTVCVKHPLVELTFLAGQSDPVPPRNHRDYANNTPRFNSRDASIQTKPLGPIMPKWKRLGRTPEPGELSGCSPVVPLHSPAEPSEHRLLQIRRHVVVQISRDAGFALAQPLFLLSVDSVMFALDCCIDCAQPFPILPKS